MLLNDHLASVMLMWRLSKLFAGTN